MQFTRRAICSASVIAVFSLQLAVFVVLASVTRFIDGERLSKISLIWQITIFQVKQCLRNRHRGENHGLELSRVARKRFEFRR